MKKERGSVRAKFRIYWWKEWSGVEGVEVLLTRKLKTIVSIPQLESHVVAGELEPEVQGLVLPGGIQGVSDYRRSCRGGCLGVVVFY